MTAHPCPWTPAILDALAPRLDELGLPVHDPFAGDGLRLGELCDQLGLPFTGTEIEAPFIQDARVRAGNSRDPATYPQGQYVVCTSPVYPNGMTDHFHARDGSRRHTYRQRLAAIVGHDRPLHEDNMGRWGNRHRRSAASEARHWQLAWECVQHWPTWVLVNVKDVVAATYRVAVVAHWKGLLVQAGYHIAEELRVPTPGQRHGANGHLRDDHEAIILARRHSLNRVAPGAETWLHGGSTEKHQPPWPRRQPQTTGTDRR